MTVKQKTKVTANNPIELLNRIAAYQDQKPIFQATEMPRLIQLEPFDPDWRESIKDKWWATNFKGKIPAELEKLILLREKLLEIGGEEVCLPTVEEDYNRIMSDGQLWYGDRIEMMEGAPSQCHSNSAYCWDANKDRALIATGYALSDDSMWRQHSWCVHINRIRGNTIVETTTPRVAYFGFVMNLEESNEFLFNNF